MLFHIQIEPGSIVLSMATVFVFVPLVSCFCVVFLHFSKGKQKKHLKCVQTHFFFFFFKKVNFIHNPKTVCSGVKRAASGAKSVLCWAQIFYHSLAAPLKSALVCTPLALHLALTTPLD